MSLVPSVELGKIHRWKCSLHCSCPKHVDGKWTDDITVKYIPVAPHVPPTGPVETPYRVDGEVQWLRCGEFVIPVERIGAVGNGAYKVLTMTKYPVTGVLYFLPSAGEVMQLVQEEQELARV